MFLLDFLYYKVKSNKPTFAKRPPGKVHATRMAMAQDAWQRNPHSATQLNKKTLILADWTAPCWSQLKLMEAEQLIDELLQQGFVIYIWNQEKLLPLKDNRHILRVPYLVNRSFPVAEKSYETIYELAQKEHNLSREEVQILDDYYFRALIDGNVPSKRKIHILDLMRSNRKHENINTYLATIQKNLMYPQDITVIRDEFSSTSNYLLETGLKTLSTAPALDQNFLTSEKNQIHELIPTVNPDDLLNIKSVTQNNGAILMSDLVYLSNLKYLGLNNSEILDDRKEKPTSNLSEEITEDIPLTLWMLDLSRSKIEATMLKKLLSNQLRKLFLSHSNVKVNFTLESLPNLESLNELFIYDTDIDDNIVSLICLKAHNLESFSYIPKRKINYSLHFENPTSVKRLFLENLIFSLKELGSTPNLSMLSLENCTIDESVQKQPFHLMDLKALSIKNVKIANKTLCNMLENLSQLQQLSIQNYEDDDFEKENQSLNLNNLEFLKLINAKIFGQTIEKLLSSAKITELTLESCTIYEEITANLQLNQLKRLVLQNVWISASSLEKIIKNCPNLTEINLSDCTITGNFSETFDFPSLKKFFSNSKISSNDLEKLISSAKELEQLTMVSGALTEEISHPLHFPKLKHLSIRNNTGINYPFSNNTLCNIIGQSPQLQEVSLVNLRIDKKDFNLNKKLVKFTEIKTLILDNTKNIDTLELLAEKENSIELLSLNSAELQKKMKNNLSLQKMQQLCLNKTTISSQNLKKILHDANSLTLFDAENLVLQGDIKQSLDLPNLQRVNLEFSNINDENLYHLISNSLKTLQTLSLRFCINITTSGLIHLLTSLIAENNVDVEIEFDLTKEMYQDKKLIRVIEKFKKFKVDFSIKTNQESNETPSLDAYRDPQHDNSEFLNNKPTPPDFKFVYKGKNPTKNQDMIIEKLCQYLIIKNDPNDLAYIPKMQDGICAALTSVFEKMTLSEWDKMINDIHAWDGTKTKLKENSNLTKHFETILTSFKNTYTKTMSSFFSSKDYTFLGDNLASFLKENPGQYKLKNPWHEIFIRYDKKMKQWIIYDPNFIGQDGHNYKVLSFKQLISEVHQCLGELVSVSGEFKVAYKIANAEKFIKEGGLLVLLSSSSTKESDQLILLLNFLQANKEYSKKSLQGLLLRNTKGTPAWSRGIISSNKKIKKFTFQLLKQFKHHHKKDYVAILMGSIAHLSGIEKHEIISALIHGQILEDNIEIEKPKDENKPPLKKTEQEKKKPKKEDYIFQELFDALHHEKTKIYEKRFETWDKVKPHFASVPSYLLNLVHGGDDAKKKKSLIELSSSSGVHALSLALRVFRKKISKPVFYVNSPDDLICSSEYIKRHGNIGKITKPPGGPLYQFLNDNQDKANPPVLIVNYDNFNSDDLVRFNELLGKNKRYADGVELKDDVQIIGLLNVKKPNCYTGEDFYSRFDLDQTCPFSPNQLKPPLDPIKEKDEHLPTFSINLFHAQDWKERLLGNYKIKKDSLHFHDGLLQEAIQSGLPIEIKNGLWEDQEFCHFFDELQLGLIEIDGEPVIISPNNKAQFVKSEGYDWENLKNYIYFESGLTSNAPILNPTLSNEFIERYQCDNDSETLDTILGLIEYHHETKPKLSLTVNLTRSLEKDEWAELLSICQEKNVVLQCHCAANVTLPTELISNSPTPNFTPQNIDWEEAEHDVTQVIQSTDIDVSISLLTKNKNEIWKVIDVSECDNTDLLFYIDGKIDKANLKFRFNQSQKELLNALEKNENVILKGKFSTELCDSLAELLLKRNGDSTVSGKLVLVSDDTTNLNYMNVKTHDVTENEKLFALSLTHTEEEILSLNPNDLKEQPLCRLNAILNYPSELTDPWQGLYHLPGGVDVNELVMDETESMKLSHQFIANRINSVNSILTKSPIAFLSGKTAVGKTTTVKKYIAKQEDVNFYEGEDATLDWVLDKSAQRKILFLDEANITERQFSEFEGLFNDPPGILYKGKYYPLDKNHKIIFAGNPLSYGGERKLASFFERHGGAFVFDVMTPEYIYQEILKPIFSKTILQDHALSISKEILDVYRFICGCSKDEILISPRELEMIALLICSYANKNHETISANEISAITKHYIYLLTKSLVPDDFKSQFEQKFKPDVLLHENQESILLQNKHGPDFIVTPSRYELYQLLEDTITLNESRKNRKNELNESQQYGGLRCIVVEGEPGVGKSDLVLSYLASHDYQEKSVYDLLNDQKTSETEVMEPTTTTTIEETPKIFCRMPVSLDYAKKEKFLIKAMDRGWCVIIDEMNSSPMMEKLMNSLLSGYKPDGTRLKQPGLIIATQNSAAMAGRTVVGKAMAKRMIKVALNPYSTDELVTILKHKGVDESEAILIANAYQTKLSYARKNYLSPSPTFRLVLEVAEEWIANNRDSTKKLKSPHFLDELDNKIKLHSVLLTTLKETLISFINQFSFVDKDCSWNQLLDFLQLKSTIPLNFFISDLIDHHDDLSLKSLSREIERFNFLQKIDFSNLGKNDINHLMLIENGNYFSSNRKDYHFAADELNAYLSIATHKSEFIGELVNDMNRLKKESGSSLNVLWKTISDFQQNTIALKIKTYEKLIHEIEHSCPADDLATVLTNLKNNFPKVKTETNKSQLATLNYTIVCQNDQEKWCDIEPNTPLTYYNILTLSRSGFESQSNTGKLWRDACSSTSIALTKK